MHQKQPGRHLHVLCEFKTKATPAIQSKHPIPAIISIRQASARRRFLVTGDTAGVSGKPTHQAKGVWRTPIESTIAIFD